MSFIIFLILCIFAITPIGIQLGLSNRITSEKKALELIEERKRVLTTATIMFMIESVLCIFIMVDCFGDKEMLGFGYYDIGDGHMCAVLATLFSFVSVPGVLYTIIRRLSEPTELQEALEKFLKEEPNHEEDRCSGSGCHDAAWHDELCRRRRDHHPERVVFHQRAGRHDQQVLCSFPSQR